MKQVSCLLLNLSKLKFRAVAISGLSMLAVAGSARAGIKTDDVNIAVSANGQLRIIYLAGVVDLPPIDGPLFGWGLDEPGVISIENSQPDGSVPPAPNSSIALEVLNFDPALKLWLPGFGSFIHNPAQQWVLGGGPFHEHPFWHIDSTDPGFVPTQTEWNATFRFVDLSAATQYAPSDPITITFTPEPASATLLLFGSVLVVLRNRRRNSLDRP